MERGVAIWEGAWPLDDHFVLLVPEASPKVIAAGHHSGRVGRVCYEANETVVTCAY